MPSTEDVGYFLINLKKFLDVKGMQICTGGPVAERIRALFLNHSIISHAVSGVGSSLHWPHMRQAKLCLRVCQVFFSQDSLVFGPPTDWLVSYELK